MPRIGESTLVLSLSKHIAQRFLSEKVAHFSPAVTPGILPSALRARLRRFEIRSQRICPRKRGRGLASSGVAASAMTVSESRHIEAYRGLT